MKIWIWPVLFFSGLLTILSWSHGDQLLYHLDQRISSPQRLQALDAKARLKALALKRQHLSPAVLQKRTIATIQFALGSWRLRSRHLWTTYRSISWAGIKGWAVGRYGVIAYSSDDGKSWTWQDSGTSDYLLSVHAHVDGVRAWISSAEGNILRTVDAGRSWQRSAVSEKPLRSVHFGPSGLRGLAVGDSGTVFSSNDGGISWRRESVPARTTIRRGRVRHDGSFWVVGDSGVFLRKMTPTAAWERVTTSITTALLDLSWHHDDLSGIAVGRRGVIIVTKDGGRTWTRVAPGLQDSLRTVSFDTNMKRGMALGASGHLLVSSDGGFSWKVLPYRKRGTAFHLSVSPSKPSFWVVGFDGLLESRTIDRPYIRVRGLVRRGYIERMQLLEKGNRGWAISKNGNLLSTRDGGRSWQQIVRFKKLRAVNFHFAPSGKFGIVVGSKNTVIVSRNDGKSWRRVTLLHPHSGWLRTAFVSSDGERLFAAGDRGHMFVSVNAGKSWELQKIVSSRILKFQFNADGRTGWVLSECCLHQMTSPGQFERRNGPRDDQSKFTFQIQGDGSRAWTAGRGGWIKWSHDGGRTWDTAKSSTDRWFNSIRFWQDGERGLAVGNGHHVFSVDGGRRWSRFPGRHNDYLHSLHLLSEDGGARASNRSGQVFDFVPGTLSARPPATVAALTEFAAQDKYDGISGFDHLRSDLSRATNLAKAQKERRKVIARHENRTREPLVPMHQSDFLIIALRGLAGILFLMMLWLVFRRHRPTSVE